MGREDAQRETRTGRLDRGYFEGLYGVSDDPWGFETSAYEREKYARTLTALVGPESSEGSKSRRYGRALEVGCSIGVFTSMLAPYCGELLAVDASERAIALARERLAPLENVRVERRTFPEETPEGFEGSGGPFDLVIASEVLYYFDRQTMLGGLRKLEGMLAPGGCLLAVHWRHQTRTYPLQGDEVHGLIRSHTRLSPVYEETTPDYRLELFKDDKRKSDGGSESA